MQNQSRGVYAISECIMGKVYSQIVEGRAPITLPAMAKNIGFLVKDVPFAGKRAEDHFTQSITVAKEIGAKGVLGMAYFDLGRLHGAKGKGNQARKCICQAIQLFEQCGAETYLRQAGEMLENLR